MLLSAVSVLVVAQPSSEVPEGLMNYPVYIYISVKKTAKFAEKAEVGFTVCDLSKNT